MPQEGPSKQRSLQHIGLPRAGSGPFMNPTGRRPRREQRFQSLLYRLAVYFVKQLHGLRVIAYKDYTNTTYITTEQV